MASFQIVEYGASGRTILKRSPKKYPIYDLKASDGSINAGAK